MDSSDPAAIMLPAHDMLAAALTGQRHLACCPESGHAGTLPLQAAICSGEPVRRSLLARMKLLAHQAAVLNLWGCTEAAADSTCWELPSTDVCTDEQHSGSGSFRPTCM